MKTHLRVAAIGGVLGAWLMATTDAQAMVEVYDISDTSAVNCGSGPSSSPHGLWTNNFVGGGTCSNYFSVTGGTLIVDKTDGDPNNWFGDLVGTAENPQGLVAEFDIDLTGFEETHPTHKEGGGSYDHTTDTPDWDFFTGVAGTLTIDGTTYTIDGLHNDNFPFQYGLGANDKDSAFGASTWFNISAASNTQMDFNLVLERRGGGDGDIPEPATLGLLGISLAGLGFAARRRRQAS